MSVDPATVIIEYAECGSHEVAVVPVEVETGGAP